MFDLGMMELLVIGVTALIVVGPKDLPVMFRKVGQFTGKMKGMAREFSRAMNDAADEAGVSSINADLRKMTNPSKLGLDTVRDAAKDFAKFDFEKESERAAGKAERGPETQRMTEERAEAARKIREKSAEVALARQKREAEEASRAAELSDEPDAEPEPEPEVVAGPEPKEKSA